MTHAYPSTRLFDAKGYVLERAFLDGDAVEKARSLLIASKDRLHWLLEQWVGESISDSGVFARHQARIVEYEARGLPKDLRHYLVGEFDLETRLDRSICGVLSSPSVREQLTRFLDAPQYYIHYPPMVRFKMADVLGSILPAHQDFTYNAHLRDFITVWVPLVDIDDEVGGVILYEGSQHGRSLDHASKGPWAYGLNGSEIHGYTKHHIHMRVGDVLIFPPLMIHESAPHRSHTRVRYSIDFRVFVAPDYTTKSYFDPFGDRVVRRD
ncbi:MAG TPA: phytanoyl-CoA dioxygenase family protein [Terriglobia bacterium]|nr:phytanoyl-CoA dioxygenase family protein [Terriglobia bacterium]